MDYFTEIEGSSVLLRCGGVYKQTAVYTRGKEVYAKSAGGFIHLNGFNATSHPRISWREIHAQGVELTGYNNLPVFQ